MNNRKNAEVLAWIDSTRDIRWAPEFDYSITPPCYNEGNNESKEQS